MEDIAFLPSVAIPGLNTAGHARVRPASALAFRLKRVNAPAILRRIVRVCATEPLPLGDRIERALHARHDAADVARVLASFRAVRAGVPLETGVGRALHRQAHSYVAGLEPSMPFWDPATLPWVRCLEDNWAAIADELRTVMLDPEAPHKGTNVWVPAARQEATSYGPDWRTLVLQDREWDPVNTSLFPITTELLRHGSEGEETYVPSVEAFFARQAPGTGISLHTDGCNFILTMHLSLDVPKNQSWIEVAGERRYWENGRALVFDTSYFHRTMNESDAQDRTVLLLRFWHPQLSLVEREAFRFVFSAIEDPSVLDQFENGTGRQKAIATAPNATSAAMPTTPPVSHVTPRAQRRATQEQKKKAVGNSGRKRSGGIGFGRPT